MVIFTLCHSYIDLNKAVVKVYPQRNDRISRRRHRRGDFVYLMFVQQKPARSERILIENVSLLIGTYMHVIDKGGTVFYPYKALLKTAFALSQAFDLRTGKGYARLICLLDKIIVVRLFILSYEP